MSNKEMTTTPTRMSKKMKNQIGTQRTGEEWAVRRLARIKLPRLQNDNQKQIKPGCAKTDGKESSHEFTKPAKKSKRESSRKEPRVSSKGEALTLESGRNPVHTPGANH
jgi:hypothetical protein